MKDPIFDIVLKVVRDTSEGFQLEIVELLYKHKEGLTKDELAVMLNLSPSYTYTILKKNMQPTGIVELLKVNNGSGNRGRDVDKFFLTSQLLSICKKVFK